MSRSGAPAALELERLSVRYPGFRLGPLSMSIRCGERVALLGANGAGKSTTLRAMAGRLSRYAGRIVLGGEELRSVLPRARARIGFLPDRPAGFDWMAVQEHLRFLSAFFPTWDRAYEFDLVQRLELPYGTPLGALSRGELAKLGLVAAEAYRPPLLLLDEPIAGLDPVIREELLSLLEACVPEGSDRMLVFSSHLLEDVARLAGRILLLQRGRLQADVSRQDLRARFPELPLAGALHRILLSEHRAGCMRRVPDG